MSGSHKTAASSATLNYFEVQLAAVSALEEEEKTKELVENTESYGQHLFFDSKGVGSLVTGDNKELHKFKQVFNAERFLSMFTFHFFGLFYLPFAIRKWGAGFVRITSVVPGYTRSLSLGTFVNFITPYVLITHLLVSIFQPSNRNRDPGEHIQQDRYFLVNLFPQLMLLLTWVCRILMISLKYAYVSRWEFDNVVQRINQNIGVEEAVNEWQTWHLFLWVLAPEKCFDFEITMSCIRRGTSDMDGKYNLVLKNEYASLGEAIEEADKINGALGYKDVITANSGTFNMNNPINQSNSEEDNDGDESWDDSEDDGEVKENEAFEKGLVIEEGTASTAYIRHGAHVRVGKKVGGKMIIGYGGKMVDPNISVHVDGRDLVKQCILHATKEIKEQKDQQDWRFQKHWLVLVAIIFPPLFFVFSPLNTFEDVHRFYEQDVEYSRFLNLSCFRDGNTKYVTEAADQEYQRYLKHTSDVFVYNLNWFICLSPASMPCRIILVTCTVLAHILTYFHLSTLYSFLEFGRCGFGCTCCFSFCLKSY